MWKSAALSCAAALLFGCVTAAPSKSPNAPDTIALSLYLKPHQATIETIRESTFRDFDGEFVDRSVMRHESVVELVPEGVAFTLRNPRTVGDPAGDDLAVKMFALAEGMRVVLSTSGELVAIEGAEKHERWADIWFDNDPELRQLPEEQRARMRAAVAEMGKPEYLRVQVAGEWLAYALYLSGKELQFEQRYEEGGIKYRVSERVACRGGKPGYDCVVVELKIPPNESLRAKGSEVAQHFLAKMPKDEQGGLLGSSSDTIYLKVRPADFRPYRMVRSANRSCSSRWTVASNPSATWTRSRARGPTRMNDQRSCAETNASAGRSTKASSASAIPAQARPRRSRLPGLFARRSSSSAE